MTPCPYCGSTNHQPLNYPILSIDRKHVIVVTRCDNCLNCWKETYEQKPLRWQPDECDK